MKIDRHQRIGGLPTKQVRDALRRASGWGNYCVCPDELNTMPGLVDTLVAEGFIELKDGKLDITRKGYGLINLRLIKRIPRSKADAIVEQMLCRTDEINADGTSSWWIERILAFGSYITDADEVGDIDLEVHLKRNKRVDEVWPYSEQLSHRAAAQEPLALSLIP